MSLRGAFVPDDIALFLDVDGTLIETAATPDTVRVPAALRNTLELAAKREQGALALISGRSLAELDRLFAPHVFPAAGLHGLELRDAQGRVTRAEIDVEPLRTARLALAELQLRHRGLLLEDKGKALAMHFRQAPQCEILVRSTMTELARESGGQFVVRAGKSVYELAPQGYSSRAAIEAFMRQPPFAGRAPVFVGDDLTDEDGFEAVNELGGYSIRVGNMEASAARFRFSSVPAVIAWLRERNLNRPTAPMVSGRRRG